MQNYLQRHSFVGNTRLGMVANALLSTFRKNVTPQGVKLRGKLSYTDKTVVFENLLSRVKENSPEQDAMCFMFGGLGLGKGGVTGTDSIVFSQDGVMYTVKRTMIDEAMSFEIEAQKVTIGGGFEEVILGALNKATDGSELDTFVWDHLRTVYLEGTHRGQAPEAA